jgi:hypothetical protein
VEQEKKEGGGRLTLRLGTGIRTLRVILDSGQFGTCPNSLGGVEEASLCGRDEADDERAGWVESNNFYYHYY